MTISRKIVASLAAFALAGAVLSAPASAAVPAVKDPAILAGKNADPYKGSPVISKSTGKMTADLGSKITAKSACGVCRQYGGAYQFVGTGTAGTGATSAKVSTSQHNPYLNAANGHSLSEISAQGFSTSGADDNIVEIGWRNPSATTGNAGCSSSTNPCLFLYAWVKGIGQGYGPTSPYYVDNPGESVNNGTPLAITAGGASPTVFYDYGARYMATPPSWCTTTPGIGAWVMSQANAGVSRDIACYLSTLWTNAGESFTDIHLFQSFDEIADSDTNPCTDMGSGIFGVATTPSAAQWVKGYTLTGPTSPVADWTTSHVSVTPAAVTPTAYRINRNSQTEYRVGGPGFDVVGGTATGTAGNC
jgi:hypothetical protein